jgi:ADP-heptose:LPS heptosyltransferase
MSEPRFLVVRLGSLGDIVHTFPAVAALRETFPAAKIIWLTHPRWKFLVESSRLASEVWPVDSRALASLRGAISRIRANQWRAAIDYQGLWKSAALPFVSGIARRIGFSSETIREYGVPLLYTDRVRVTAAHVADQNGELSFRAGARNPVESFALTVPEQDATEVRNHLLANGIDRYVVLSPGGGWRSKCWPAERYGALCREIRNKLGLRCVLNYAPGEESLLADILAVSGGAGLLPYSGTLGQLMALLRDASCVVAGDTGPLHLAVALAAPVVALFGPTDPARNGPYRSHDIVLRSAIAVTTYKRADQPDAAMLAVSVSEVSDAVTRRIAGSA